MSVSSQNLPNLLFAVSTPGGEELHQPHIIALQYSLIKVVISQLHHILAAPTAATITLLGANTAFIGSSFCLNLKKKNLRVQRFLYLPAVAGAAGLAAESVFHQRT